MATASQSALAISGGAPVRTAPFPSWPQIEPDEIAAATRVLQSGKINYWTGDEGRSFEKEFAQTIGRKYAVALANGSVALELALHALQIKPGDEVIVPSRSFIASASCVRLRGAVPVFADVDRDSGDINVASIRPLITKKTKAVIVVHVGGWPCEMEEIIALAGERGLKVIEDCAQAQGASYNGKPVGSFGDAAIFSFCQDKIMTTGGEGGMLVSDNESVWLRAWSYKDHGKSYAALHTSDHGNSFRWVHESLGSNWRVTEMQSAMGRVMLPKVAERVRLRQRNAKIIAQGLSNLLPLRIPIPPGSVSGAFYRLYAYLRPEKLAAGWDRNRVQAAIEAEGVPCFAGSCSEIYLEKAFENLRPRERHPVARELGETSLAFLVHHTLSERDMQDVVHAVTRVIKAVSC
jgi:dTDP-4-amino-4,6-dideoxygalactose transaminase